MKWIGERISFVDGKDATTIVVHPESVTWIKGVMGAWVAMWFAIGAVMTWALFTLELTDQEWLILVIFMVFWAYYAVRVTRSLLWLLYGKEMIKIDEVGFSYKKAIKTYGKANIYYLENISKVRTYAPENKSLQASWELSPWIKGSERLEFDYMGKVIRFGRKLEQKDAEQLFKFVTKKVEQRLKKK